MGNIDDVHGAMPSRAADRRDRDLSGVPPEQSEPVVVRVDALRMAYGDHEVLTDVTFSARHGEVLALLGPNGAGKTSTIEILEGFRNRSAGQVSVLGTDPAHGDEQWCARVGVVLQSWRDHAKWRVRELLAHLGSYYKEHSTETIRRPIDPDELIASIGLTEQAEQKVSLLSGGQRRRVDVAIGMVGRPDLLFLDEPTAGLDPEARRDFHGLVRELAARQQTTILLTTHDLDEAEKLADRIMILDHGRIVADGTSAELSRAIVGEDEVSWTYRGQRFVRTTPDVTAFVLDLVERYRRAIGDLDIRRSTLEDTYLALVRRAESSDTSESTDRLASTRKGESR